MTKDQQYKIFFENWKKYISEKEEKKKGDEEWPVGTPGRYYDPSPEIEPEDSTPEPDLADLAALAAIGLGPSLIKGAAAALAARKAKKALAAKGAKKGLLAKIKQMGAKKAAIATGGFLLKRVLGPVGIAWTAYDIYNALKDDDETTTDAKNTLQDPQFQKFAEELKKWQQSQEDKNKIKKIGVKTSKIQLPTCDDIDAKTNKACWEYHYIEDVLDSPKEKKAKIEAAKQKARDFIASKQKKTEKPAPVKSTAETGKYVNLYSKITGQSVEAKQKRKQEREAIRAIAAEAQQKFPTDWTQDTEFLSKVKAWSDKHGVPMQNILALIYHETAFTMSPGKVGSNGCTGLIMFCPNSGMQLIKKDGRQLAAMTRAEQWDYVEMFLDKNDKWKKDPKNIASLYLAVFLPAFADLPDNAVIASKFGKKDPNLHPRVRNFSDKIIKSWWRQNPANRDRKDKNRITKSGLKPILSKYIPKLSQFANNDYRSQDIKISDAPPPAGVGGSISSIPGRDR
jgi:hypothetical protein